MATGNSVKIRIDGDASDLEKKLKNIGNVAKAGLADVKAGIDMASAAVKTFASVAEKGIAYNSTIEQLKTSFEVMTGSAEKAAEVTERLRVMGAQTPFEMKDLASTTQLLMQYGFTADEALDRMSMLGDVAQGNVQAMNSIALGYAQMSSAGKVNLVDLKQMIQAGFNPLQEISERTGESMASLYDRISKGTITVDEITESMRRATSEGGRFYQSMEKQSQTLNGQLSTLQDNTDQLLGSVTEGLSEGLRMQILPFANNLVGELQAAFDSGGYQGLVDTATGMIPDLMGMMTGELQKGIAGLSRWLPQGATQLMQALPSALRAAATVAPQLTQALFEVAGSVLGDLVGMLPELMPIVGEGFLNLMTSALTGAAEGLDSVFAGIGDAMKEIGLIAPTASEAFAEMVENVDQATIDGIKKQVDIDLETVVTVDDYQTQIDTALDSIESALANTPGLSETERETIKNAIINGTGIDVIQLAFDEMGVDSTAATTAISTAQESINTTVEGLGLSPAAESHIQGLISNNASASEIQKALESFGVDPGTAANAAASITGEMNTLNTTLAGLGIDPGTFASLLGGLTNDKNMLVTALQLLGVSEADIATVTASYDTVSGSITAGIDGIYKSIADEFTDGVPESDADVQAAKTAIEGVAQEAKTRLDEWYNAEVARLQTSGLTGETLTTELANAEATYNELSGAIESTTNDLITQTEGMVGKSTAYCQEQLGIMQSTVGTLKDLTAQIDMLTSKEVSAAQTSRNLTIEGVTNDQGTQLEAFLITYKEYTDKIRQAEEEYLSEITTARENLEKGGSEAEYADAESAAKQKLESAKQHAANYYQQYVDAILAGIFKADPEVSAAIQKVAESQSIADLASQLNTAIVDAFNSNTNEGTAISLEDVLGELDIDESGLSNIAELIGITPEQLYSQLESALKIGDTTFGGEVSGMSDAINAMFNNLISAEGIDFTASTATLAAAIDSGYLLPAINGVDYTSATTLFQTLMSGALTVSDVTQSLATDAAVAVAENATAEEKSVAEAGAKTAGESIPTGTAVGIGTRASVAINAAAAMARAIVAKIKQVFNSNSPSKVAIGLGGDFGDGMSIGLRNSMAKAVNVAKQMSGEIVTSAELSRSTRVNMPGLSQEIVLANQQSQQPVNLYVNGRQLGKVMAADNQAAQNSHNRSIALGVGK